MKYVSQVDNKVTNIFAMDEGILIEFSRVHMPSFKDIIDTASSGTFRSSKAANSQPSKFILTRLFICKFELSAICRFQASIRRNSGPCFTMDRQRRNF